VISLSSRPPGVITSEDSRDLCCFPTRDRYVELVASFRADGFEMCVDLCA